MQDEKYRSYHNVDKDMYAYARTIRCLMEGVKMASYLRSGSLAAGSMASPSASTHIDHTRNISCKKHSAELEVSSSSVMHIKIKPPSRRQ
jgi:hypothetical protein